MAADINLEKAEEAINEANETSSNHMAVKVDVANLKNVNAALVEVLEKYKEPPTIVVNSAGITRDNFLLKLSEDDFKAVINTNLNVS